MGKEELIFWACMAVIVFALFIGALIDRISQKRTDAAVKVVKQNNLIATNALINGYERDLQERDKSHAKETRALRNSLEEDFKKRLLEAGSVKTEVLENLAATSRTEGIIDGYKYARNWRPQNAHGFVPVSPEFKAAIQEARRQLKSA